MTITMPAYPIPKLNALPTTLPVEGAIQIELQDGVPIFRASISVQKHIETLLYKAKEATLTTAEAKDLELYEEIDDYLSFVNRVVRNLVL